MILQKLKSDAEAYLGEADSHKAANSSFSLRPNGR